MSNNNEWDALKQQFDALMHTESLDAESAEEIFDLQFRRRFVELINNTAQNNNANEYRWPRR